MRKLKFNLGLGQLKGGVINLLSKYQKNRDSPPLVNLSNIENAISCLKFYFDQIPEAY